MVIAPRCRHSGPRFQRPSHKLKTAERGYDSKHWKPFREAFVEKMAAESDFVCAECKRSLLALYLQDKREIQVDHIKPHSGPGDPLLFDVNNLQLLCRSCHGKKTAAQGGGFQPAAATRDGTTSS